MTKEAAQRHGEKLTVWEEVDFSHKLLWQVFGNIVNLREQESIIVMDNFERSAVLRRYEPKIRRF
ncbi:MAG: hypothetical protein ACXVA2_23005 [Mucilaginibacter sp.]